jgi:hypothetical protein
MQCHLKWLQDRCKEDLKACENDSVNFLPTLTSITIPRRIEIVSKQICSVFSSIIPLDLGSKMAALPSLNIPEETYAPQGFFTVPIRTSSISYD